MAGYPDSGKKNNVHIPTKRMWYTGTTALTRGAVLSYNAQTTLAGFTKGPGVDVDLCGSSPANRFAGILSDDSVGSTGGWVNVHSPRPGDVIWAKVDAALDQGDGVLLQQAVSAATQGFADSGAYASADLGICLLTETASDNPAGTDNLAPILITNGNV